MPSLRPFRAIRYDPTAAPDLGAVLCPPYDVIEPDQRARLAARDAHNAVHLELPEGYDAAARLFAEWLADGTLRQDARPLIYPYEQRYVAADGGEHRARGFYCLLRLEPFGPGSGVRPHERTLSGPKEDRLRLLNAVRANLSPIVLLFDTGDGEGARRLDALMATEPASEATDEAGVRHRLWTADPLQSEEATALLGLAATGPLTIADGHHRYETALRFRAEQAAGSTAGSSADWVLALVHDARSGGLTVLPTHRVVRGLPEPGRLAEMARELFRVERRDMAAGVVAAIEGLSAPAGRSGTGKLGLWTRAGGAILEADRGRVEPMLPAGASDAVRWLDVSLLSAVLPALTGSSEAELLADDRLVFTKSAEEAVAMVDAGTADSCFLLAPTPIQAVLDVAAAGERMSQKSTYFYPKAATGLVFNRLEG